MALATAEDRIAVTHDYDLPEIAVRSGLRTPSVLLIAYSGRDIAAVVSQVTAVGAGLVGYVTIIEGDRVRRRPLG